MAILRVKKESLAPVFEFASGVPAFDLIDITVDVDRTTHGGFLSSPGYFVYRSKIVVNQNNAASMGVEGLIFKFYNIDPRRYRPSPSNEIAVYDVRFDTADRTMKNLGNFLKKKTYIDTFSSAIKNIFLAGGRGGTSDLRGGGKKPIMVSTKPKGKK